MYDADHTSFVYTKNKDEETIMLFFQNNIVEDPYTHWWCIVAHSLDRDLFEGEKGKVVLFPSMEVLKI